MHAKRSGSKNSREVAEVTEKTTMSTVSIRSEEILTDDTPTKTSSGELPEPPKPKPKSRPPPPRKTRQFVRKPQPSTIQKPKRASEQIESSVSPVRPGTSSLSGSASGTKPKLIQAKADQNVRNPPSKAVPANVFKVCSRRNRPPQSESKTSPPTTNSSSSNTVKKAPAKSTAKPASLKKTSILIPKPNTLRRTTPKAEKTEKTQVSITRSLRNYSKDDTVEIFGLAQKALVEGTPSFECRLKDFVDKCLDSSMEELKTEYELTREIYPTDRQFQCFRHPKHSFKNRYHDIYCLDNTRVVLRFPNRDEEASYVHANYVDGKNLRNKFILTQGPLMKTVGDFWRMVWQEKVSLIIMVCDHVEEDRKKCAEYLPTRERTDVANLQIKRRSQTVHKYNLTETKITLTYGNRDRHEVTHWKWLGWPDHKVPEKDVRIPFRLLQVARAHKNVIVHCSAGVGRSGTLVAMEICLMDLLAGTRLNVPDCVKFLRAKRAHAVQTFSQYLFIYRAFVDLAISLDLVTEDRIQPFLDAYEAVLCSK